MKIINTLDSQDLVDSLKKGGISVIPTDTIYGVVGSFFSKVAVEKIYEIKGRDADKGFIVLISSLEDLKLLNIDITQEFKKFIEKYWPGKVSVIFPRENDTLAVRFPDYPELINLIKKTGPLVAPSANPQGLSPAKNIEEAINYFGKNIEYYVDAGELESSPSTLVKIGSGEVVVLREGAVKINHGV